MKVFKKISTWLLGAAFVCAAVLPARAADTQVFASAATNGTGYTSAADVDYEYSGKNVYNWGAREEDCTFLSPMAQDFYAQKTAYSYETLSQTKGGSSQSSAPSSALYSALQTMMKSEHSYETSYDATRSLFRYTDCEQNNKAKISSFYSGILFSNVWDGGNTWNREHTWPNSKGLNGRDEDDIIMLRPTVKEENSGRGNDAYGEGSGYYDPNAESKGAYHLRGDCARIFLYVYVRWNNTKGTVWGTKGVMQSLDVLLRWMEEDPVDTWEMGRNDATEAITGTRNVFIDYPEYAWQLFGRTAPTNMSTPSGMAKEGVTNEKPDVTPDDSSNGSSELPDVTPDDSSSGEHSWSEWIVLTEATESTAGSEYRRCLSCGEIQSRVIPALGGSSELPNDSASESEEGENGGCSSTIALPFAWTLAIAIGVCLLRRKRA